MIFFIYQIQWEEMGSLMEISDLVFVAGSKVPVGVTAHLEASQLVSQL